MIIKTLEVEKQDYVSPLSAKYITGKASLGQNKALSINRYMYPIQRFMFMSKQEGHMWVHLLTYTKYTFVFTLYIHVQSL
jgi:hypothetical protein